MASTVTDHEPDRPTDDELKALLETRTQTEIADRYGVSRQAVSKWVAKAGLSEPKVIDHKNILPWKLKTEDHRDGIARALRWWNSQQHGIPITDSQARDVDKLLTFMRAEDVVVDYDREDGFCFRRRDDLRDGPDGLIRRPA